MIYKFLKSCTDIQFFLEKRFVFLNEETHNPGVSLGGIRESFNLPYKQRPESQDEPAPTEEKQPNPNEVAVVKEEVKGQLDDLRGKVDEKKYEEEAQKAEKTEKKERAPRLKRVKSVQEGLADTRKRLEEDLFGKEKLQPYADRLKGAMDAIEKMDADGFYKFIKDHNTYNGNFKDWNKDLCDTFHLELNKDEPEEKEYMRYAAALQMYLAEYFASRDKKDIFQTTKNNPNPFIYIDGKLGGYTMSVLAAYWNDKNQDKAKQKGELAYTAISEEYGKIRKNNDMYGQAIQYLKDKLSGKVAEIAPSTSPSAAVASVVPATAATVDKSGEKSAPKKTVEEKLSPELQKQAEIMVKGATGVIPLWNRKPTEKEVYNSQKADEKKFEESGKDPSKWGLSFSRIKGSWPDIVFRQYKDLYEKSTVPEDSRASDPILVRKFQELKDAIDAYHREVANTISEIDRIYLERAQQILKNHPIPQDVDVTDLKPKTRGDRFFAMIRSDIYTPAYERQQGKVRKKELEDANGIDNNIQKVYFADNFVLGKTLDSLNIDIFKGNNPQDREKSKRDLITYLGGGDEKTALSKLNEVIRLRNMYYVYEEYVKMHDNYIADTNKAIDVLGNSYDKYLQLKTKDKDKDKKTNELVAYVIKEINKPKEKEV